MWFSLFYFTHFLVNTRIPKLRELTATYIGGIASLHHTCLSSSLGWRCQPHRSNVGVTGKLNFQTPNSITRWWIILQKIKEKLVYCYDEESQVLWRLAIPPNTGVYILHRNINPHPLRPNFPAYILQSTILMHFMVF